MNPVTRNRIGIALFSTAAALLIITIVAVLWLNGKHRSMADPDNVQQVARGAAVYTQYCVSCHGRQLQGQPEWRTRNADGRLPAPPHDASGHTWHHPDNVLFDITKSGLIPGRHAPPDYQSDMPAFGAVLPDEDIWAVLAYIKSSWPEDIRAVQQERSANQAQR